MMYVMMSVIPSFFKGKAPAVSTPEGVPIPGQASNMWPTGTPFVSNLILDYLSFETFRACCIF